MDSNKIRVAGFERESVVDGPGFRYVIFFQGCEHNCFNCHNQKTHVLNGGEEITIEEILRDLEQYPHLDGVTISGGEPFLQNRALLFLVKTLKEFNYHILLYTGFILEELMKNEINLKILESVDILIDGPFVYSMRDLTLKFRGSKNQRMINLRKTFKSKSIEILQ